MDTPQLILEYGKILATLIAVILAAWFVYKKYLKENNDKKELIVNAVFGDLTNVIEHYTYARNEIHLVLLSEQEKNIRLRYSQFGSLRSIEKIDQLGNLSSLQIRLILQLDLRIRNTDLLLNDLLNNNNLTNTDIERLKNRMDYCIFTANEIVDSIVINRSELREDRETIREKIK